MGGGEGAVGQAVVAAGEGDDAGTAGVDRGGFEGGFDGFGAGVGEEDAGGRLVPATEREPGEFAGELEFEFVGMNVAHRMQELPGLLADGGDDAGVGVADGGDAEGGGEVNVAVAVGVPDVGAGGALPEDRPMRREVGDVAGFDGVELPGKGA